MENLLFRISRNRIGLWEIGAKLYQTSTSTVYLAENIKNGRIAAVKEVNIKEHSDRYGTMPDQDQGYELVYNEARLMSSLSHKNLVKYYEAFHSPKYFYICMKLASGTMAIDIISRSGMKESNVKIIMRQLLDTIEYLHGQDIAHGDVKLENIMVDEETGQITLLDLGFAQRVKDGETVKAIGWTKLYSPPEAFITARLSKSWDMWSCGVVMYAFLTGFFPFSLDIDWQSKEPPDLIIPPTLSRVCVDLLVSLLRISPDMRLSASQARCMKFVQ
tara:strand:- start:1120 stop:1941 length:822 start_codon:yes stop_codon:yes gene_type:complete